MGLVCRREHGLAPLTFVQEYLGEMFTPWRWFEIQVSPPPPPPPPPGGQNVAPVLRFVCRVSALHCDCQGYMGMISSCTNKMPCMAISPSRSSVHLSERHLEHLPTLACGAQDAIKKSSKDELPDFYNIVLDRPKDDAAGYDVLFIDAASKVRLLPCSCRAAPCFSLQIVRMSSHSLT